MRSRGSRFDLRAQPQLCRRGGRQPRSGAARTPRVGSASPPDLGCRQDDGSETGGSRRGGSRYARCAGYSISRGRGARRDADACWSSSAGGAYRDPRLPEVGDLDTPAARATRSARRARCAGYSISKEGALRGLLDQQGGRAARAARSARRARCAGYSISKEGARRGLLDQQEVPGSARHQLGLTAVLLLVSVVYPTFVPVTLTVIEAALSAVTSLYVAAVAPLMALVPRYHW